MRSFVLLLALLSSVGYADSPRVVRKIALVQYDADSHFGDVTYNQKQLVRLATEAVQNGATMVVFPEGSNQGYVGNTTTYCAAGRSRCYDRACLDVNAVAEPLPGGATTTLWQSFARDNGVTVVYHLIEKDGTQYFNALGVVGPEGYLARYRKRELYGPDRCYATPGRGPALFSSPEGRFGLMICADGNESSYYAHYKNLGAKAAIVSMDWDQSANGPRSAALFFQEMASSTGLSVYASDNPAWDGTGYYPASGGARERHGLPRTAVGHEGISFHELSR